MYEIRMIVCVLFLCSVFPITLSSHFLGGNVIVRPKRGGTHSEVEIISHISWKRSSVYCNSSTLANNNYTIRRSSLTCQYGCTNSITLSFLCIEYSVEGDWSYLEGHGTYTLPDFTCNNIPVNTVTIGTEGNAWISPFRRWNISTTFSRTTRNDIGKINSSPLVISFPYLYLQEYHYYTIPLAVSDPDNDHIRCRWATGVECSSVCNSIPGAILDSDSCTIRYNAINGTGVKVAAIMIEDFLPSSSIPLSSVAHQFVVEIIDSSQLSCTSPPRFITPLQGTCINIPPNTLFTNQLRAISDCSNVAITSIQIIAPIGINKGGIQHVQGTNQYYTNIVWMPTADQQNDTHFLCLMAVNSESLTSEQSCIKLAVGYHPPTPLLGSPTPNPQLIYPSNNILQIMFDRKIQRPSTSAFIRFYRLRELVYQIDSSLSLEVAFNGKNLTIMPNYRFTEGIFYYINFDEGVVESVEGCQLGNKPIHSETFWTFKVISLPDVVAINSQRVGQPLILQCSVTTIRDTNSRVDFVWNSNGVELERVEGAVGESSVNNSAIYTDHYIISQLTGADNNSLYICEVMISGNQLISFSGNITLNVTEPNMMDDIHSNNTCSTLPQFDVPSLPQGICLAVPLRTLFIKQIMVTSGCSNVEITSIKVFAPNGTSMGELQHVQGTNHCYINVAWKPTAHQHSDTHFLCFVAINLAGVRSEPFCMHLAVGYHPPAPIADSANHQVVYPSNNTLHIMFDMNIQRPSISAFITFYKLGAEVYLIDVSLSTEVTFNKSSLTIVPNYTFTEGSGYYITFDRGVVQSVDSTAGCQLVNEPVLSNTFWTFNVMDLTPGTKVMDTTCDDNDDDDGDDDGINIFIIFFSVSAGINLLLVAIITITCLLKKQKKSKPVLTNYRVENRLHTTKNEPLYDIPTLERQTEQKQGSCQYVNMPQRQKEKKLPPMHKRHAKPDAQIQLEQNPSYHTTQYSNI